MKHARVVVLHNKPPFYIGMYISETRCGVYRLISLHQKLSALEQKQEL